MAAGMILRSPLCWQAVIALLVVAAATLVPPRRGAMLLVPITVDGGSAVRAGVAAGGALVRVGPWPGSVVMWGDRGRLAAALAPLGVLLVAAPPGGCAAGEPGRA